MAFYAFSGHCYASPDEALDAFNLSFPWVDANQISSWLSSSVTAAGVVTYSYNVKPISTNTVGTKSGTLQLAPCAYVDTSYDYVQGAGFWSWGMLGVLTVWWVAKNAGLIIGLVKSAATTVRR